MNRSPVSWRTHSTLLLLALVYVFSFIDPQCNCHCNGANQA